MQILYKKGLFFLDKGVECDEMRRWTELMIKQWQLVTINHAAGSVRVLLFVSEFPCKCVCFFQSDTKTFNRSQIKSVERKPPKTANEYSRMYSRKKKRNEREKDVRIYGNEKKNEWTGGNEHHWRKMDDQNAVYDRR